MRSSSRRRGHPRRISGIRSASTAGRWSPARTATPAAGPTSSSSPRAAGRARSPPRPSSRPPLRAAPLFGWAVDVSGTTVVVGAHGANSAYVFVEPASGWAGSLAESAKLVASDGVAGDGLGFAVSAGGATVVAGAPFAGGFSGPGLRLRAPRGGLGRIVGQRARLEAAGTSEELGVSVASPATRSPQVAGATTASRERCTCFAAPEPAGRGLALRTNGSRLRTAQWETGSAARSDSTAARSPPVRAQTTATGALRASSPRSRPATSLHSAVSIAPLTVRARRRQRLVPLGGARHRGRVRSVRCVRSALQPRSSERAGIVRRASGGLRVRRPGGRRRHRRSARPLRRRQGHLGQCERADLDGASESIARRRRRRASRRRRS